MPRTIAIGDIHGCLNALLTLEKGMGWSQDDRLVALGDYVDRGPDSRGVMEWAIQHHRSGHLVALRGNHEAMMLMARDNQSAQKAWMSRVVGGVETLASYGMNDMPGRLVDVPDAHWLFMESQTRLCWETERFFFAHAGVDPSRALSDQDEGRLLWERFGAQPLHPSGKRLICGHTKQDNGLPLLLEHGVCIDTGAHSGGWLTGLNVDTGEYGQANERGEFRSGRLEGWAQVG